MKSFQTITPLRASGSASVIAVLAMATFLGAGACDQKTSTTNEPNVPSRTSPTYGQQPAAASPGQVAPVSTYGNATTQPGTAGVAADNTAKNRDDRSGDTMTPMDQSESIAHIKTTADIRAAVVGDETLSMTAKNCKIITDKTGRVTLRGPVTTQAEKDNIGAKARSVAGNELVTNDLEVKTN
jgi:hypothetical protein